MPLSAATTIRQALKTAKGRSVAGCEVSGTVHGTRPVPSARSTSAASRSQHGAKPTWQATSTSSGRARAR
ncbi:MULTISPECIES: hypothetical protein [Saccharothrix]|uniref:hypothetical protein n=1 Tax=Saccharothrix TaxID=2071 RepID=UPI001A7E05B3|nr:hypothetical protein [Saccharothrix sp. CB00851]